jgi:hypothetical protein
MVGFCEKKVRQKAWVFWTWSRLSISADKIPAMSMMYLSAFYVYTTTKKKSNGPF